MGTLPKTTRETKCQISNSELIILGKTLAIQMKRKKSMAMTMVRTMMLWMGSRLLTRRRMLH